MSEENITNEETDPDDLQNTRREKPDNEKQNGADKQRTVHKKASAEPRKNGGFAVHKMHLTSDLMRTVYHKRERLSRSERRRKPPKKPSYCQ